MVETESINYCKSDYSLVDIGNGTDIEERYLQTKQYNASAPFKLQLNILTLNVFFHGQKITIYEFI